MTVDSFMIGKRRIGRGHPPYVIAELSGNHSQDFQAAESLVRAAKEVGADAVKLQTYTPDTLTIDCDEPPFRISGGTLWDGKTLYDLYQEAYTPWDWQPKLEVLATELGLDLLSSAFDETSVDFLESELNIPAYKVASFEIVDLPLIRRVAATKKPIILSTGMSSLGEIEEAVTEAREAGASSIALLKCTSSYPAKEEDMNLRTIRHLSEAFGVPVGLSDHSRGIAAPIAAIALGACIIEKHLTLSRSTPGPDSGFSLEPAEFAEMVRAVRAASAALGTVHYGLTTEEDKSRVFRRSLFVVQDVKRGDRLTPRNVRSIRPGGGLHTRYLPEVLGKTAAVDIKKGTPLSLKHVQFNEDDDAS